MTLRADVDSHFFFAVGRTCCECVAAAAFNVYVVILWVCISFHVDSGSDKTSTVPYVAGVVAEKTGSEFYLYAIF
jgi:hypothetical protein